MKKRFHPSDLKDLPLNVLLSLPSSKTTKPRQYDPLLNEENKISSLLHQNRERTVFEGFYKSITRKLR